MSGATGRWRTRLGRLETPEVLLGALITAGWAAGAAVALTGVGLTATTVGAAAGAVTAALWLHLAAADTGHHSLSWMSTGVTVLCVVLALARRDAGALLFAVGGVTALAHNELIRLSYTRRREAVVDRGVPRGAVIGLVAASALAVAGTGLAQAVSGGTGRSWLWMPATVGVLVLATMVLTVAPVRRAPVPSRSRWRPGDRIPPPPAGGATAPGPVDTPDLLTPAQVPGGRPVGERRAGR
ncbi:MAG: hypothetical protein OEY41_07785 [Acidimicrobiia bacterium]|nr:hypothetical protein [Acidimicrobiia bacterium]MDH5289885.1 hypothetical protein [Acidimicrobiia bacterium]